MRYQNVFYLDMKGVCAIARVRTGRRSGELSKKYFSHGKVIYESACVIALVHNAQKIVVKTILA